MWIVLEQWSSFSASKMVCVFSLLWASRCAGIVHSAENDVEVIISSTTGISVEVPRGSSPKNLHGRRAHELGLRPADHEARGRGLLFDVNNPVLYGKARPF